MTGRVRQARRRRCRRASTSTPGAPTQPTPPCCRRPTTGALTTSWYSHTPEPVHPTPPYTLLPTPVSLSLAKSMNPYTLHPAPYTLHPTPYTLPPMRYTLHLTPYILHPTPIPSYTLHPAPFTLHTARMESGRGRHGQQGMGSAFSIYTLFLALSLSRSLSLYHSCSFSAISDCRCQGELGTHKPVTARFWPWPTYASHGQILALALISQSQPDSGFGTHTPVTARLWPWHTCVSHGQILALT